GAGVLVENALFATLDPTVRRASTPDGRIYTLADTVGFVRSLPTELVEAFRSTLEEAADADLLLHVVDASHPDPEGQVTAVRRVADMRPRPTEEVDVVVPYSRGDLVSRAHSSGEVVAEHFGDDGTHLRARVDAELAAALRDVDRHASAPSAS